LSTSPVGILSDMLKSAEFFGRIPEEFQSRWPSPVRILQ
jgi:hypothetical protein